MFFRRGEGQGRVHVAEFRAERVVRRSRLRHTPTFSKRRLSRNRYRRRRDPSSRRGKRSGSRMAVLRAGTCLAPAHSGGIRLVCRLVGCGSGSVVMADARRRTPDAHVVHSPVALQLRDILAKRRSDRFRVAFRCMLVRSVGGPDPSCPTSSRPHICDCNMWRHRRFDTPAGALARRTDVHSKRPRAPRMPCHRGRSRLVIGGAGLPQGFGNAEAAEPGACCGHGAGPHARVFGAGLDSAGGGLQ
mmetsp:Transcript_46141/g.128356  ORF Transcript_46141/g.128356 Transcript_46141/m.128356 type:complete len:245 (-) Transcript_46141:309-1043(-)